MKRLVISVIGTVLLALLAFSAGVLTFTRTGHVAEKVGSYDRWLGKPIASLSGSGIMCTPRQPAAEDFRGAIYCLYEAESGPINEVILRVSRQTVIEVILIPHAFAFELGDLIALRGRPELEAGEHAVSIRWPVHRASATTDAAPLPVSFRAKIGWLSISAATITCTAGTLRSESACRRKYASSG